MISKNAIIKSVVLSVFILLGYSGKAQGWTYLGTPAFSDSVCDYTQLAVDHSNTPYIAFEDQLNPGMPSVSVMKYSGTNWIYVGAPRFSQDPGSLDLVIDKNGTPYIAFSNEDNANKATVMKFDGSNWVNVGASGFTPSDADYVSLAIDSNLTPYVAFEDGSQNDKISVMKFNGTAWVYVGAAGISNQNQSNSTSITIGPNNMPWLTFRDYVNNNQEIRVVKFNGSSWVDVGAAFNPTGTEVDIVIDQNTGTPFVVFEDAQNSDKISVKQFTNNTWSYVGTAGFSQDLVHNLSMVIGSDGNPIVCFRDWGATSGPKASVMKFNGFTWEYIGLQGFSLDDTYDLEMAVGSNGTLYAGFVDLANAWKSSVMAFGNITEIKDNVFSKLSIFPNPSNKYLKIQLNNGDRIKSVFMTNVLGEKINIEMELDNISTINIPNGIYSLTICTGLEKVYSQKIVIAH